MVQYIVRYDTKNERCSGIYRIISTGGAVRAECPSCGNEQGTQMDGNQCVKYYNKQVPVYDTKQEGWLLSCGKTEETIESATIIY